MTATLPQPTATARPARQLSSSRTGAMSLSGSRGLHSLARPWATRARLTRRLVHMVICSILGLVNTDRLTVTMDAELGAAVRNAAARAGTSVSGWLARAAADSLRTELLGVALDAWEAEDGPFTDDELDAAAAVLGVARRARGTAA